MTGRERPGGMGEAEAGLSTGGDNEMSTDFVGGRESVKAGKSEAPQGLRDLAGLYETMMWWS